MGVKRWIVAGEDAAPVDAAAACVTSATATTALSCHGAFDDEEAVADAFDAAERDGVDATGVVVLVGADDVPALADMELADWERTSERRLRQAFLVTRRAVDGFLAAGTPGRLVFVVGWPAGVSRTNEVIESAIYSFMRSVAKEYGRRGLTCNLIVACGGIHTEQARLASTLDLLRFAVSPESSFVNGETLRVP
jgi:NAD(P)-dependent dehydrogenase (short-subunit alcohol dehydrogenase family)